MQVVTFTTILLLWLNMSGGGDGTSETSFFGELNDRSLLPCDSVGNPTPSFTRWIKNGKEILSRNHSASSATTSPGQRIRILSNGSLDIKIVIKTDEGTYACNSTFQNYSSETWVQFRVIYAPERRPLCLWEPGEHPSQAQFNCSWFGAYPTPILRWGENHINTNADMESHLYSFAQTDSLVLKLNRSELFDGQKLKCMVKHPAIHRGEEKACFFILKPPFPEGEPLVTALADTNITLTCTEESSLPPASTSWRRGAQQEVITPGSKYAVSLDGPTLKLTIINVTMDDQGLYFCHSENPLAIRELEVLLTVKTSSVNTGAIIGVFLAVLILGIGGIIAKILYASRHRICLGGGFGTVKGEREDIFSLVDSDDEMFPDAVPSLPLQTNGHTTTMVQIHRIPSSDHEDKEVTDRCPQQQDDTAQTQEHVDLVMF